MRVVAVAVFLVTTSSAAGATARIAVIVQTGCGFLSGGDGELPWMIEKTAMDEPQLHSQERYNIRLPTRRRNDRDGSDPCGVSLRLSHTQEPAHPVSWTNTHSPG